MCVRKGYFSLFLKNWVWPYYDTSRLTRPFKGCYVTRLDPDCLWDDELWGGFLFPCYFIFRMVAIESFAVWSVWYVEVVRLKQSYDYSNETRNEPKGTKDVEVPGVPRSFYFCWFTLKAYEKHNPGPRKVTCVSNL